jgi:hypothetical protein
MFKLKTSKISSEKVAYCQELVKAYSGAMQEETTSEPENFKTTVT